MANLSTTSAIAAQLGRELVRPPHMRGTTEKVPSFWMLAWSALVDEARLVVVGIFVGPVADQVVVERRAALGAAAGRLPLQFLHHRRHRLQRLRDDQAADVVVAQGRARAHRLDGAAIEGVAQGRAPASCSTRPVQVPQRGRGLGVSPHLVEGRQSLRLDRAGDLALADAVAAADLGVVRQAPRRRPRDRAAPPP